MGSTLATGIRILTNRLELLLRTVLAFPKASRRGLDCRMMSLTCCCRGQEGVRKTMDAHHVTSNSTFPKALLSEYRKVRGPGPYVLESF